jgi:hypothetical protein
MPIIPTTWEAEIERTEVLGQPKQKGGEIPSQQENLGMVPVPVIIAASGRINRRITV